ncbi:MAG: hypothetical protein KAG66_24635, partial [Methylococcales bacterium]|nr:hypothetical protein [Methylococcales bacterium]
KIIASLTLDFPLAQLLDDLKVVQIKTIEVDLYNHIYEKIWSVLGLHARQLLELMPMISQEGADQRQLLAISDLTQSQLNDAIQELRFRSLLETTGSLQTKFYRCHRLTETWIKSAIVRWPDTVT